MIQSMNDKFIELFKYMPPSYEDVKKELTYKILDKYEICYIKHDPSLISELQTAFIKICVDEKLLPEKFLTLPINRHGIIGRYLDDSNSIAYRYWYRFMCIDDEFREWEQPFYAVNECSNPTCLNEYSSIIKEYYRDKKINKILDI